MDSIDINLGEEFRLIESFETSKSKPFCFCRDGYSYVFFKSDRSFVVETNKVEQFPRGEFRFRNVNGLRLDTSSYPITILDSHLRSTDHFSFEKFLVYKFSMNDLREDDILFYRLILPKKTHKNIRFDWYFSGDFSLCVNGRLWSGIRFEICNLRFNILDLEKFLVIECGSREIALSEFDYYCRIALAAMGFITGYAPMDEGYYFGYKNLSGEFEGVLYVSNFVGTYDSSYSVVTTNPYEFFSNLDVDDEVQKEIEILKEKVSPVERGVFENLCQRMIDDEEFGEIIFSLLSVNNRYSKVNLYLQGVALSAILEMLSSKICNENEERIVPIRDKNLAKELKSKLHDCAKSFFEDYKDSIGDYECSPIKKKIDNINQPTNRDKLIRPFEILGLRLTERDKDVINERNKFLHGNIPVESLEPSQTPKLFYYVLRLNLLNQALILKYSGFSGVVKNLPKIFLDYVSELDEYLKDEKYYREI